MFRLTSSFFSLLVFGAATANARLLSSHSCDLECPLNAPCRFGEADFSERTGLVAAGEVTHQNGMHCDCPIGKFLLIVRPFVIRFCLRRNQLSIPIVDMDVDLSVDRRIVVHAYNRKKV